MKNIFLIVFFSLCIFNCKPQKTEDKCPIYEGEGIYNRWYLTQIIEFPTGNYIGYNVKKEDLCYTFQKNNKLKVVNNIENVGHSIYLSHGEYTFSISGNEILINDAREGCGFVINNNIKLIIDCDLYVDGPIYYFEK